jgi:hypothetical protein
MPGLGTVADSTKRQRFSLDMGIGLEPDQQTRAFDVGYPRGSVITREPHHAPGS